jgi:hypothetical protein
VTRRRPRLRDLRFGQWWLVAAPLIAGVVVVAARGRELDATTLTILIGGSIAVSLGLLGLMLYGDEL